jgi:hypothetical protein
MHLGPAMGSSAPLLVFDNVTEPELSHEAALAPTIHYNSVVLKKNIFVKNWTNKQCTTFLLTSSII